MKFSTFWTQSFITSFTRPTACSYPEPDESIFVLPSFLSNFKIFYNIVLPSTPRSCEWHYPFGFSKQNVTDMKKLKWSTYVTHAGEAINAYTFSFGRVTGKRLLVKPRMRWIAWARRRFYGLCLESYNLHSHPCYTCLTFSSVTTQENSKSYDLDVDG